jgi:hypothetical protein
LKNDLPEFKCPLCHSSLESEDYYQAIEDLKKKVSETYGEEHKKAKQDFEEKLEKINKSHKEEMASLKSSYLEQTKTLKTEIEGSYKQQLEELKKTYDKLGKDNQKNFTALEKQIRADCKKEIREKEKNLSELKREQTRMEKIAFEKGKSNADIDRKKLENDIKERDLQIERFKRDADDLKKQLQQSQSELKGEIGEIDLYTNLTQAFEQDFFTRQKRGTAMGDIVQKIRTTSASMETPIIYDNKQAESVTAKDIEKAKKYKEIHATEYVIIVSSNLPKKDVKNGLFGEKEGILLCHPCIVVDVAKQIRRAIIEIGKQSESRKDRENKESKLYDYIRSSEFASTVEKLHDIYQKAADLQDSEEKAHTRLWKERRKLQSQINDAYVGICTGVDCIIQEQLPMQELVAENTREKETKEACTEIAPELLLVKRKKAKKKNEEQLV